MEILKHYSHIGRDGISNHQPLHCLLNRLLRCRSKKTSKLHVTGLCAGNSPVTGEFSAQRASKRKMFQFDDVIMTYQISCKQHDTARYFCIWWTSNVLTGIYAGPESTSCCWGRNVPGKLSQCHGCWCANIFHHYSNGIVYVGKRFPWGMISTTCTL